LAAQDFALAAEVMELAIPEIRRNKQTLTAIRWFRALPEEVVSVRPLICATFASVLLSVGDVTGAEHYLAQAERWIGQTPITAVEAERGATGPIVADTEEFRRLPLWMGIYRAAISHVQGDTEASIRYAQTALDNALEHQLFLKGAAAALVGIGRWASGDVDAAYPAFRAGMESIRRSGNVADVISGTITLADMRIAQGRLRDAEDEYRRSLAIVAEHAQTPLLATADVYLGLGNLLRERGEIDAAESNLQRGCELADTLGLPENRDRREIALAGLCVARGQLVEALGHLDRAEQFFIRGFYPNTRPMAARRVPMWLAMGDIESAARWAQNSGLRVDDMPTYLNEYSLLMLTRVGIANGRVIKEDVGPYLRLLDRLEEAAATVRRNGSLIEISIIRAMVLHAVDDLPGALEALTGALVMAEPENYVRTFLDAGPPIVDLLTRIESGDPAFAYASRLADVAVHGGRLSSPVEITATSGLAEALTSREIEILHLVAAGMRNQQIADALFIELATVKRHIANIYGKLGVSHRTEAILLAKDLGLL
jgi:LuxR family maltose regulon positive regulatory protein